MTSRQTAQPEPLALTIAEAAAALNISTRHCYHLVTIGHIRSVRLGRRLVIPTIELRRLLEET